MCPTKVTVHATEVIITNDLTFIAPCDILLVKWKSSPHDHKTRTVLNMMM